jgi:hypothetical protein
MSNVGSEWDFYCQAFRLHQRLSQTDNEGARNLLRGACAQSISNGSRFGRAFGLLSFTIQNSWLCNWIDKSKAGIILGEAVSDIKTGHDKFGLSDAMGTITSVGKEDEVDTIVKAVILAYGQAALGMDGEDFDNQWSHATAALYNNPKNGNAVDRYRQLRNYVQTLPLPEVTKFSIDVDYADALFFVGDPPNSDLDAINEAIGVAQAAVLADLAKDPKQHRWNWTLGWAYYERSHYSVDRVPDCEEALKHLTTFNRPHDLIRKNLIAAYVGAGKMAKANEAASEFMANNEGYTVAVEARWPYRDDSRREKWQADLVAGGLPSP